MNTKLNFAQRFFIWQNNFLFGRVPFLQKNLAIVNAGIVRRPKWHMFIFIGNIVSAIISGVTAYNKIKALQVKPMSIITDEKWAEWEAEDKEIEETAKKHAVIIENQGPHAASNCDLFKETNGHTYCHLCTF